MQRLWKLLQLLACFRTIKICFPSFKKKIYFEYRNLWISATLPLPYEKLPSTTVKDDWKISLFSMFSIVWNSINISQVYIYLFIKKIGKFDNTKHWQRWAMETPTLHQEGWKLCTTALWELTCFRIPRDCLEILPQGFSIVIYCIFSHDWHT